MSAAPIETQSNHLQDSTLPRPTVVPPAAADDSHAAEERAERAVFRDAAWGAVIGAVICAPIWAAMVWLALLHSDQALAPSMAMAAGIGVLAGVFAGGWAGTLVGANTLEEYERSTRPKPPSPEL